MTDSGRLVLLVLARLMASTTSRSAMRDRGELGGCEERECRRIMGELEPRYAGKFKGVININNLIHFMSQ